MALGVTESVARTPVGVTNAAGQLVGLNSERQALQVQLDPAAAAATVIYLLLAASGVPSASNFDVAVTPTLPWDGMIGPVVYRGAIQAIASAAGPFQVVVLQA